VPGTFSDTFELEMSPRNCPAPGELYIHDNLDNVMGYNLSWEIIRGPPRYDDFVNNSYKGIQIYIWVIWILLSLLLAACSVTHPNNALRSIIEGTFGRNEIGYSGKIAYIGADGNVYITTLGRENPIQITDDANTSLEGAGRSYHRLSWSRDGRLAFAAVERDLNNTQSQIYTLTSPKSEPRLIGENDDHFVIYLSWAPSPCPSPPNCRELAYLIEEKETIGLHLVNITDQGIENRLIGLGIPFYFSWSPDGSKILWHTGGARRYNDEAVIEKYHLDDGRVQSIPHDPGLFLSPAWSPQGMNWMGVTAESHQDRLQIFGRGRPITVVGTQNNFLASVWSPNGTRVAYAVRENHEGAYYGPIHIYDLEIGESRQITENTINVKAFFWAPDGKRIAYLSHLQLPKGNVWYQWRVFDLEAQVDRGFADFNPTASMRFMISSFNQYAQSHSFWSPDGRHLIYAERAQDLEERIWVIDTWAKRGTEPIFVDEGSFGIWSWE
jgi:Tol biopolymer transport system component